MAVQSNDFIAIAKHKDNVRYSGLQISQLKLKNLPCSFGFLLQEIPCNTGNNVCAFVNSVKSAVHNNHWGNSAAV